MSVIYPQQRRTMDPYSDHRYTDTINRFTKIISNNKNVILPYDVDSPFVYPFVVLTAPAGSFTFENGITHTYGADEALIIGPGTAIFKDVIVHSKEYVKLSFLEPQNYVGSTHGYNHPLLSPPQIYSNVFNTGYDPVHSRYFVLMHYEHSRSFPTPKLSFVIAKERSEFLNNRDKYIYLASATIYRDEAVDNRHKIKIITSIDEDDYKDVDELNGNAIIERPDYKFKLPFLQSEDLG